MVRATNEALWEDCRAGCGRVTESEDYLMWHAYLFKPAWGGEKIQADSRFLKRKVAEYERVRAEIGVLKAGMSYTKGSAQ